MRSQDSFTLTTPVCYDVRGGTVGYKVSGRYHLDRTASAAGKKVWRSKRGEKALLLAGGYWCLTIGRHTVSRSATKAAGKFPHLCKSWATGIASLHSSNEADVSWVRDATIQVSLLASALPILQIFKPYLGGPQAKRYADDFCTEASASRSDLTYHYTEDSLHGAYPSSLDEVKSGGSNPTCFTPTYPLSTPASPTAQPAKILLLPTPPDKPRTSNLAVPLRTIEGFLKGREKGAVRPKGAVREPVWAKRLAADTRGSQVQSHRMEKVREVFRRFCDEAVPSAEPPQHLTRRNFNALLRATCGTYYVTQEGYTDLCREVGCVWDPYSDASGGLTVAGLDRLYSTTPSHGAARCILAGSLNVHLALLRRGDTPRTTVTMKLAAKKIRSEDFLETQVRRLGGGGGGGVGSARGAPPPPEPVPEVLLPRAHAAAMLARLATPAPSRLEAYLAKEATVPQHPLPEAELEEMVLRLHASGRVSEEVRERRVRGGGDVCGAPRSGLTAPVYESRKATLAKKYPVQEHPWISLME